MSTAADLLEFLTSEVEDGQSTAADMLAQARARIAEGGGEMSVLTSGAGNGKTYSFNLRLDAAQVARICRQAIAAGAGDDVISSGLDFSSLGTLD